MTPPYNFSFNFNQEEFEEYKRNKAIQQEEKLKEEELEEFKAYKKLKYYEQAFEDNLRYEEAMSIVYAAKDKLKEEFFRYLDELELNLQQEKNSNLFTKIVKKSKEIKYNKQVKQLDSALASSSNNLVKFAVRYENDISQGVIRYIRIGILKLVENIWNLQLNPITYSYTFLSVFTAILTFLFDILAIGSLIAIIRLLDFKEPLILHSNFRAYYITLQLLVLFTYLLAFIPFINRSFWLKIWFFVVPLFFFRMLYGVAMKIPPFEGNYFLVALFLFFAWVAIITLLWRPTAE